MLNYYNGQALKNFNAYFFTLKQQEIMKTFKIESSHSVYIDDYEQGEGAQVNSYEMDGIIKAENPVQAIEKYMEDVVGYDFDIKHSLIEDNTVFYSSLVDGENIQASESQKERWEQGKCILYTNQFSIVIYELNRIAL
jgi:hypothetical protein